MLALGVTVRGRFANLNRAALGAKAVCHILQLRHSLLVGLAENAIRADKPAAVEAVHIIECIAGYGGDKLNAAKSYCFVIKAQNFRAGLVAEPADRSLISS